jgi:hypothetical protein
MIDLLQPCSNSQSTLLHPSIYSSHDFARLVSRPASRDFRIGWSKQRGGLAPKIEKTGPHPPSLTPTTMHSRAVEKTTDTMVQVFVMEDKGYRSIDPSLRKSGADHVLIPLLVP